MASRMVNDTSAPVDILAERISTRQAVVGVIGLGYVGLPLLLEKARAGFRVLGFDRNVERVALVNARKSYIDDITNSELEELGEGRIGATTDFDALEGVDVVVICVPTPLDEHLAPDLQYVCRVGEEIAKRLRKGQLVSLESTTYPGTTDEVLRPILERSGLRVGEDIFLAHSPERVDPGNKTFNTKNTSKVVGASDQASAKVATQFYRQTIERVVVVESAKAAEMVKVYENTFRAVNIALANEMALLCDRMGLNVWDVLDAAFTKPFGIMPFYPGPGVGGHCIPIDPHYLEWKAKQYGFNTRFIALAGETNRNMPEYVLDRAARMLNASALPVRGARVLLIGLSYKPDVSDTRESPALEVFSKLVERGALVSYHDPFVPTHIHHGVSYESVSLDPKTVAEYDLVMITTAHSSVNYASLVAAAKRLFDTRNATRDLRAANVEVL